MRSAAAKRISTSSLGWTTLTHCTYRYTDNRGREREREKA